MAVKTIKMKVCDMCGSDEGVRTYRVGIVGDGRGVAPDLCAIHQKPLEEVMDMVPKGRSTSGLRKPPAVKTEAQVKRARRRPAKKTA